MPDLVVTLAVDAPGATRYTMMARLLLGSLRASGFADEIAVLACTDVPIVTRPLAGVVEHRIDRSLAASLGPPTRWKAHAPRWIDGAAYRRVLYLDCDSLAVGDLAPLLGGAWQLGYQPEYGATVTSPHFAGYLDEHEYATLTAWGVNAGTFAVAGSEFAQVLARWRQVMASPPRRAQAVASSDQDAWNRVVLDSALARHAFDEGLVGLPHLTRRPPPADVRPRVLHFAGAEARHQLQKMRATYLATFGSSA